MLQKKELRTCKNYPTGNEMLPQIHKEMGQIQNENLIVKQKHIVDTVLDVVMSNE